MFNGCSKLSDLSGTTFEDTDDDATPGSGITSGGMQAMFQNCNSLTKIGILINRGGCRNLLTGCNSLQSIEEFQFAKAADKYYDTYVIFGSSSTNSNIVDITFTKTGYGPNYFVGANGNNSWYKVDFSRNSIVSLFNCLETFEGSSNTIGSSINPLGLKPTTKARLTDEDIAIATSKGWTIG